MSAAQKIEVAPTSHEYGLRPRSSSYSLLRTPSNSGSSTSPSQSHGSSPASFGFSLKSSLSSAPTSALQSEPAHKQVLNLVETSRVPLDSHLATHSQVESVSSWLSSAAAPSSHTVVYSEESSIAVPDVDVEVVSIMAAVAVVELEKPMPTTDVQDLILIGHGPMHPVPEAPEDEKMPSSLPSRLGALLITPTIPKCITAEASGCKGDLEASTPSDACPQANAIAQTDATLSTSSPSSGTFANGGAASAAIFPKHDFSSWYGFLHRMLAISLLAIMAFVVVKRQCACDGRHVIKVLVRHISVSSIPAVVEATRRCSTSLLTIYSLLVPPIAYIVWGILNCPRRRFLPLIIDGKVFDVKVDSAGCNIMPYSMVERLGLKKYDAPLMLFTPFRKPFYSKWAVEVEVSLPGCEDKEMLTFHVGSDVAPYPTVDRVFRDKHQLRSSKDKRYVYRACNPADYIGVASSGALSHADNSFDWLNVELTLPSGTMLVATALLDTGSDVDAVSLSFITKNFPRGRYQKCSKYIKCTANGHRVHVTRIFVATIFVNGEAIERSFLILPGLLVDMILGDPFHIQHDPLSTMAKHTFLKPLIIVGSIAASQFHCGMVDASTGTSMLMKWTRKLRKQPSPPPSAQLELALRRAEAEEYKRMTNATNRTNALANGPARTEALRREESERAAAILNLEHMDRAFRNMQAQEDNPPPPGAMAPARAPAALINAPGPAHVPALPLHAAAPNPAPGPPAPINAPGPGPALVPALPLNDAGPSPALAPVAPVNAPVPPFALAPFFPLNAAAPTLTPAPALHVPARATTPTPSQADGHEAGAAVPTDAAHEALPPAATNQQPLPADAILLAPAEAGTIGTGPAGQEAFMTTDDGANIAAKSAPKALPQTVLGAENGINNGTTTSAMLLNTGTLEDTESDNESMYVGQEPSAAASMLTVTSSLAQTPAEGTTNVENESHATGVHDAVILPPSLDPATTSTNARVTGSSGTPAVSYRTRSSESPAPEISTGHINDDAQGQVVKADTTASNNHVGESAQSSNGVVVLPAS